MSKRIRISEIFGPTIQGEGPLIGRPSIFVRTAGCDYRCSWCDTLYAVLPEHHHEWTVMTSSDIVARVNELAGDQPVLVSLSGGNPALQPLDAVISLGRRNGHSFAMETQASVSQPWFANLDWLILLQVGNPAPLAAGATGVPEVVDFGDLMGRLRWLAARTLEDRWFDATVLPQLHVLAWGNIRGV
jgi:7-carboxy-7-deazaguanine synthase